jgi:putative membrane protein
LGLLIRIAATAVALGIATALVDGIEVSGEGALANALTLIGVAVVFGLVNAILKPLIKVLGCVLYVITLGLIGLVVNALLFLLTDWIAGLLGLPFHVDGFWDGFWGAIIVGVVGWAINLAIPDQIRRPGHR